MPQGLVTIVLSFEPTKELSPHRKVNYDQYLKDLSTRPPKCKFYGPGVQCYFMNLAKKNTCNYQGRCNYQHPH